MRKILAPAFTTAVTAAVTLAVASPAFAASDAFFSLDNTNFVVSIAFLVFLGVLVLSPFASRVSVAGVCGLHRAQGRSLHI